MFKAELQKCCEMINRLFDNHNVDNLPKAKKKEILKKTSKMTEVQARSVIITLFKHILNDIPVKYVYSSLQNDVKLVLQKIDDIESLSTFKHSDTNKPILNPSEYRIQSILRHTNYNIDYAILEYIATKSQNTWTIGNQRLQQDTIVKLMDIIKGV